jgi:hypothetical protein
MTYWTVIPPKELRCKFKCVVIDQLKKPTGARVEICYNYDGIILHYLCWVHGFNTRSRCIQHMNKLCVPNSMRPQLYKSYNLKLSNPTKLSIDQP